MFRWGKKKKKKNAIVEQKIHLKTYNILREKEEQRIGVCEYFRSLNKSSSTNLAYGSPQLTFIGACEHAMRKQRKVCEQKDKNKL